MKNRSDNLYPVPSLFSSSRQRNGFPWSQASRSTYYTKRSGRRHSITFLILPKSKSLTTTDFNTHLQIHISEICPKGSKVEVIYCIRVKVRIHSKYSIRWPYGWHDINLIRYGKRLSSQTNRTPTLHRNFHPPTQHLYILQPFPPSTRCSFDRDFFAVVDLALKLTATLTEWLLIKLARHRDGAVWSNTSLIKERRLEGELHRLSCELERMYWVVDLWVPRTGANTCYPL